MLELALATAAVALSYAADGPRGVARWMPLRAPARSRAARALALALVAGALILWNVKEPGPAAFLAVPLTLLAAGTVLTLGAPLARRIVERRPGGPTPSRSAPPTEPTGPHRVALDVAALDAAALDAVALDAEPPPDATRNGAPPTTRTVERILLVAGATLGTLPVALLASAAIARFLPLTADARYATGFGLAIPLWQLCMCLALLARRGATVLGVCAASSVLLAAVVFGIRP